MTVVVADRPIKRIQRGTNGTLIRTAQKLYPMHGLVLDLTPGDKQGFWMKHRPTGLMLLPSELDYRCTGIIASAGKWDHVVFDPPYVAPGGRATSTIPEMNARYGMHDTERTPMGQWEKQILPGLTEAHRLLRRRGLLWFKCMDYINAGEPCWFTKLALPQLEARGFRLVDEFILDGTASRQPKVTKCAKCNGTGEIPVGEIELAAACWRCKGAGSTPRVQRHARNAHSVLMIARKR